MFDSLCDGHCSSMTDTLHVLGHLRSKVEAAIAHLEALQPLHVVLTEPPGPTSQFVELETPDGKGVRFGRWQQREDGNHALVLPPGKDLYHALTELRTVKESLDQMLESEDAEGGE